MLALTLLATVASSLPLLGEPVGQMSMWIRDSDYEKLGGDGAVLFRAYFKPDGKPDRCVVDMRIGDKSVEPLVCDIVFKRFRFDPSVGMDGAPAYRILFRSANFRRIPSGPLLKPSPIAVINATNIPKDGEQISVAVAVDAAGNLAGCAPFPSAKGRALALASIACGQMAGIWKPLPEVDSTGQPVVYVRDFLVEFRPNP